MSDYEFVEKTPLKLKIDCGIKKKKKKHKNEKKLLEQVSNADVSEVSVVSKNQREGKFEVKPTKAEIAFQKMQEKMQKERIMQKASMTHKQRVEELNRHLDSLTEHFDIPKVSWTK